MRPPHRVLMTADAVGGVWSYALSLAEALDARAQILLAVTGPAPSPAQRAAAAAVPGLRLAHRDFPLEWMREAEAGLAQASDWLLDLGREFCPDLVHVNGYAAAAAGWSVPVIVVAHSCVYSWWQAVHGQPPPLEWGAYARRVAQGLAAATRVVAPSRAMLRALGRHYSAPRGARIIPNGCRLDRYSPAAKEKIVLAAGRLWDEAKNLAALDRAAAQLPWPVMAAGSCAHPDGRVLAPAHLTPLGELPSAGVREWMARAAVFAAPACYEPFGLSVLEAAASGCALVLGDIDSVREHWDGAAVFVPPHDHGALARSIAGLMRDDCGRERLAAAARERAQRYSASRMGDRYAALYDEVTEEGVGRLAVLANER